MSLFTPFTFIAPQKVVAETPSNDWTPSQITTLGWWDTQDTGTITTVSGDVSQWDDKSGNGYNATQGTAGNRPTLGTNTLNGYDVINFNGSTDVLDVPLMNYTNQSLSIFFLGNRTGRDGSYSINILVKKAAPSDAVGVLIAPDASGGGRRWGMYTSNSMFGTNTIYTNNNWEVFEAVSDTTSNRVDYWSTGNDKGNTTLGLFNGTSVFNSGNSAIGNDQYGSAWQGDIAEIVVVDGTIGTSDRQKIEGYMAWRWGLEGDLPAGHPYKSAAPTV